MIDSLETERVEGKRDYQTSDSNGGAKKVNADRTLTTSDSRLMEFFKSQFRQVTCLSAITSWGFTWSDLTIETNIHAFNFRGVNASSVISTRRGSSPSVDHFASYPNAHGVTGFNCFNALPTYGDLLQGISNSNSFIKNLNFWMDKEQVSAGQNKYGPGDSDKVGLQPSGGYRFDYQSKNNESSDANREPDRARAKEENIIHTTIFSQLSGLEWSQA